MREEEFRNETGRDKLRPERRWLLSERRERKKSENGVFILCKDNIKIMDK